MEYKGFVIRDYGYGYHVYGISADTIKYGFVRNFETVDEAMGYIDKLNG